MSFVDLTVWIAKLFIAFKIVEFLFAAVIVVVVLVFVGFVLYKADKGDVKTTYTITKNWDNKEINK